MRKSSAVARTAGAQSVRALRNSVSRLDIPWARCGVARAVREGILRFVLTPLMQLYVRQRVAGRERFEAIEPPVLLVANHTSHLDTPAILRALPRRWRKRTAVLAAADYFYRNRLVAALVSLIFNTVPVERRGGGPAKDATAHLDRLMRQRWNLLLYPEGTRSRDGRLGRLHKGAAFIASRHKLRIVPICVSGTRAAMPPGRSWPRRLRGRLWGRRHRVEIRFGTPIDPAAFPTSAAVMEQVRTFLAGEAARPAAPPSNAEPGTAAPQPDRSVTGAR